MLASPPRMHEETALDGGPEGAHSAPPVSSARPRADVESLWIEHRRWVAAVLLAYKPRSHDLDDLLQEVAMTLVSKVNQVRQPGNVRAWLRTVAINVARAAARHDRTRPQPNGALTDEVQAPTDAEATARDALSHSDRVLAIAQSLPESYREPLMLRAVQGMRSREISTILGLPEATVDTRISRARRMVRERLDGVVPARETGDRAEQPRSLEPSGSEP